MGVQTDGAPNLVATPSPGFIRCGKNWQSTASTDPDLIRLTQTGSKMSLIAPAGMLTTAKKGRYTRDGVQVIRAVALRLQQVGEAEN